MPSAQTHGNLLLHAGKNQPDAGKIINSLFALRYLFTSLLVLLMRQACRIYNYL